MAKYISRLENENGVTICYRKYTPSALSDIPAGVYEPWLDESGTWNYRLINSSNDKPVKMPGRQSEIASEIKNFLESGKKYKDFSLPHKRGYLLHGPPGCGKSTFLRLIEDDFVDIFRGLVLVGGVSVLDAFDDLRCYEPVRPVMFVLEDIEHIIERSAEERLLEFLDGQTALNNVVVLATTNYLERIPTRLKARPSRFDRVIEVGYPDIVAREEYLKRFNLDDGDRSDIADVSHGMSMADLKEIVIGYKILGEKLKNVVKRLKDVQNGSF